MIKQNKSWPIVLVIICTLLTSTAQFFYKLGAKTLEFNLLSIITNYYLIIGVLIYAIAAVLLIMALKKGDLSVLYPIIATSYIWVAIISFLFFNEKINFLRILGIIFIIIGVSAIGIGSKNKGIEKYTGVIE